MGKRKLATALAAGCAATVACPAASGAAAPPAACWLLKSEPHDYSIAQESLAVDRTTTWDGVRSTAARARLRAMRVGERCLFYHSSCKQIGVAGEALVRRTAYPDPADGEWLVVDIEFAEDWGEVVSLSTLKEHREGALKGLALFTNPRLSVQPVSPEHYEFILSLRGRCVSQEQAA
ncbi:hypothetical protein AB1Y20_006904 [Prymnesium parvum]|uniref:EVE domain-containing protein n=1 Tax=Prymnesium parvum TaxID=97485 RepID=A0AB34IZC2_PRYPA